ncbi:hypothetical protein [Rothia dentocariosa]|uniref:hypothetical protein n=1 Tax=Rothia dentocariosa TaxID=2047 RepID=UPI000DFBE3E6|nr:hypothetical protein [Rothia dentocariosa]SUE45165.1 Uncharacterised protein [Rothia dentocariosa]
MFAAYTVPWALPASSYFQAAASLDGPSLRARMRRDVDSAIPPADVLIGFTIYFVALWTFTEDIPYSTEFAVPSSLRQFSG